jgi:ABC-type polar amino acid transport system ATPase subunit
VEVIRTKMNEFPTNLLTELTDRIAVARGAAQWHALFDEVENSALPPDDREQLKNMIIQRFDQERCLRPATVGNAMNGHENAQT